MQQLFSGKIRFKNKNGKDYPEWEEKRLSDFVLSHKGGASLKPSDFRNYSGFEVIPKKAICSGGFLALNRQEPTFCSESFYLSNEANVIDKSYLVTTLRDLVPSGPSIGYIVQYNTDNNYILAQGVYAFLIDETHLSRKWLTQFSNTLEYRKVMQTIMVGSTQVHIRNKDF
jgi:type I restriction enzyme S subunit